MADSGCQEERQALLAGVSQRAPEILALARWMGENPELSLVEYATSDRYVAYLEARGFEVSRGSAGLETAFVAERGEPEAALCVALLAEMDALPEIGHACGHNLSGPASLLAAAALSETLPPATLRVRVVGCPAEE
ncbi:MAG: M20 family metallopeptidase, partial [Myxococcota bacterium]